MPLLFSMFCCFWQPGLQVTFTNIQVPRGSIYIAVYNRSDVFLDPNKACAKRIIPINATGTIELFLSDLPPGTYALSCFHDTDGNGVLNKNMFGVPTEPYGFSNNARPRFRAPNWNESKFVLPNMGGSIAIKLEKW